MLRMRVNQEQATAGRPLSNRVAPDKLNDLDRRILKEAFREARRLQARLAQDPWPASRCAPSSAPAPGSRPCRSRQLLDHAAEHGYGVPAFNINNMEQALAIMEAADAVDAPVIIQASRRRSYANDIMLKHMMDAVTEIYPHIPVCVHLDHGNEPRPA
jgi:hypothetical protein